jgi:hypothetical protein
MASACLEQRQIKYASKHLIARAVAKISCTERVGVDKLQRDMQADGHRKAMPVPETAQDITAGAIRAQVLVSVTGVNDADGTGHTGVEAGDGVVKDHEGDSKGGANGC